MVNLFLRAIGAGAARTGLNSARWECHGDCLAPYWTQYFGRPRPHSGDPFRPDKFHTFKGGQMTMHLDISTRCRNCDNCRRARFLEWRHRIREEVRSAARSWFGTLTMSPEIHYRVMVSARLEASATSVPWESLPPDERWRRVALTSLKEVTKYVKRVRKEANVPFRYVVVTERHKSGLPHFHALVHEIELKPVRHSTLSKQWHLGFEKWRLVKPVEGKDVADYVAKYVAIEAAARIRASQGYGREQAGLVGPLLASFNQIDDL